MHSGWLCAADKKKPRSFNRNLRKSNVLAEIPIPIENHKFKKQTKLLSFFKIIERTSRKNEKGCPTSKPDVINTNTYVSSATNNCIKYSNRDFFCNTLLKKESVIHISDCHSPLPVQCTYLENSASESTYSENSEIESMDFQSSSVDSLNEDFSPCILTSNEQFRKLETDIECQPRIMIHYNNLCGQSFHFIDNKTSDNYENEFIKSNNEMENEESVDNSLTINPPSPVIFTEQFSGCYLNGIQFRDKPFYCIDSKTKAFDNENELIKLIDETKNTGSIDNSLTINPPSPIVFTEQFSERYLNTVQSQPPSPLFFTDSYSNWFP